MQPKMNIIKLKCIAMSMILLYCGGSLIAQESVNSAGGDFFGSGGSIAQSIGQVVYTANSGINGSSSQGVQHAYEIFTLDVHETELIVSLSVFPNPTSENLTLQFTSYESENFTYQLVDSQGKLLAHESLHGEQTLIHTERLPAATYFVYVLTQENKKIQSFKVIKN